MGLNSAKFRNLSCRVILVVIELSVEDMRSTSGYCFTLDQDVSLGLNQLQKLSSLQQLQLQIKQYG